MKTAIKKFTAMLLALTVILSSGSFVHADTAGQQKLDKLVELSVIKGDADGVDGTETMERYRSMVMMLRLKGLEADMNAFDYVGKPNFTDAAGKSPYVQRLMAYFKAHPELGVIGYTDGSFKPLAVISAKEHAKIMLEVLGYTLNTDYTWASVTSKALEIGLISATAQIDADSNFTVSDLASFTYDGLILNTKGMTDKNLGEVLGFVVQESPVSVLTISSVTVVANTKVEVALTSAATKIKATSFIIKDAAGQNVAVSAANLSTDGKMITLTTASQTANAIYTLTINAVDYKFVGLPVDADKPQLSSAVATSNSKVTLTFNENMDASALNIANYSISGLSILKAEYDVDADDVAIKTAVILTTAPQTSGTIYKVVVTNVMDIAGNAINADNDEFQFGGLPADTAKPELTSAVALTNTSVKATFTEKMDKATAENISNYTIASLTILKAELSTDKLYVTLTTAPQTLGTIYKLVVVTVADESANVINADKDEFQFGGLAADTTKPQVQSAVATTNTTIKVTYNENMDETTAENIANYAIAGLTITNAELNQDNKAEVKLTTSAQTLGSIYKVIVTNATDLSGNVVDADKDEFQFGGLAADATKPEVSTALSTSNTTVKVTFNEPISDVSGAKAYNYYLGSELGYATKAVKDTITTDGTVWILTTKAQVAKVYTLDVTGVEDLSKNVLNEDKDEATFGGTAGAADTTAPKVTSAVAIDKSTIVVTFNEEMTLATIAAADFTFSVSSGTEVGSAIAAQTADAISIADDKKTVTLQFNTETMTAGVVYKVTVATVNDTAGNAIAGTDNYALFAGSSATNAAPKVTSAMLVDNQTLKITFSEPVTVTLAGLVTGDFVITGSPAFTGDFVNFPTLSSDKKTLTVYYAGADATDVFGAGSIYTVTLNAAKFADALGVATLSTTSDENKGLFAGVSAAITAPKMTSVIAVDKNTIDITFNQAITSTLSSANVGDIVITNNSTGAAVAVVDALIRTEGDDGNKLRVFFNNSVAFTAGTVYKATLAQAKIVNGNGTAMAAADNYAVFAAVSSENAAPKMLSATATTATSVEVTFSEYVDGIDLVAGANFTLSTGTVTDAAVKADTDNKVWILTTSNIADNTIVVVTLSNNAAADPVMDEAEVTEADYTVTTSYVAK